MKKGVLLVVVLLVLALSLGAFAFQNEPTGFGGLVVQTKAKEVI